MAEGYHSVIRVDAIWLAIEPMDMRAGPDTALARVVKQFGEAKAHHAYLFTNKRCNRMKVLVHDGFGLWLLARRLHEGRFHWMKQDPLRSCIPLTDKQWNALVVGLPWQQLEAHQNISII